MHLVAVESGPATLTQVWGRISRGGFMDAVGSSAGSTAVAVAYETALAQRSIDQQRLQGAQAVQLIDAAMPAAAASASLPPGATFSVRV
jgi:hypothetical protein